MLNIYFYANVPFQSDYANIIQFANKNALINYLSSYKIGEKTGIQMFWQNNDSISLENIYETANYLLIEDTNAVIQQKFYFIDSITIDSASCGVYNLICDIWHSYSYDINFKPSLCTNGHAELIAPNAAYYLSDYTPKFEYYENINMSNYAGKKLLNGIENENTPMTMIAIVSFEANAPVKNAILFSRKPNPYEEDWRKVIWNFNYYLSFNECYFYNESGTLNTTKYTFSIEKCYLIPNYALYDELESYRRVDDAQYNHELCAPYRKMVFNISTQPLLEITEFYRYNVGFYDYDITDNIYYRRLPLQFRITIASDTAFESSKIKPNAKYMLGTLSNAIEIHAAKNANFNQYLLLYLNDSNQIAIYLNAAGKFINLTNEFEIPFKNDNYNLYMATNQATIDAENKAATMQLISTIGMAAAAYGLSGVTGGASLMFATGAISSGISYGATRMKQNAKLEDAKKIISKNDATYSAALLTMNHGVGVFEFISNDSYAYDYYNNYGNAFNAIINNYKFTDANYNFYYIKFGEVNITGNFNNGIKKQIEAILLHGVRFWLDSTAFLENVSYKKS